MLSITPWSALVRSTVDLVAAGDLALLAARHAVEDLASGQLGQVVAAEGGDDLPCSFSLKA